MKQSKKRNIKPSQFFTFILIVIIGVAVILIMLSGGHVTVYRNPDNGKAVSRPIQDKINQIYAQDNIKSQYQTLEQTKQEFVSNRGNIPQPIIETENQLIREMVADIDKTARKTQTDPIDTLPDFQELINLYEQLPQLPIADSMEDLKQTYSKELNSGEKDLIQEYISQYNNYYPIYDYFNDDAKEIIDTIAKKLGYRGIEGWEQSRQELIANGVRLVEYLKARHQIATETDDLLWAYDIAKETIPLYSEIPFNDKLPNIEAELMQSISRIKYIWQEYSEDKNRIIEKIKDAQEIYESINLSIESRIDRLEEKLKEADSIKRSFSLKKRIIRFQNDLVSNYYDDFENGIASMLNQYVTSHGFQNIINEKSVKQLKDTFQNYLKKDFVMKFHITAKVTMINEAMTYLKTLSDYDRFQVTVNSLTVDKDLGKMSVSIVTYPSTKDYDGSKIRSYNQTEAIQPVKKDGSFVYEYNNVLEFPYDAGEQIIIMLDSDEEGLKYVSSNNTAYPEDKRGYHFQVFSEMGFDYHNMKIDFNTTDIPDYPIFFGKLFS